jgi:hypothetical protein
MRKRLLSRSMPFRLSNVVTSVKLLTCGPHHPTHGELRVLRATHADGVARQLGLSQALRSHLVVEEVLGAVVAVRDA